MVPVLFLNISSSKEVSGIIYNLIRLLSFSKVSTLLVDEEDIGKNFSTFFQKKTKFDLLQFLNGYVSWDDTVSHINEYSYAISSYRYAKKSKISSDVILQKDNNLFRKIKIHHPSLSFVFLNVLEVPFSIDGYGFDGLNLIFFVVPDKNSFKDVIRKIMGIQMKKDIKNIYLVILEYEISNSDYCENYVSQLVSFVKKNSGLDIVFLGCLYKEKHFYSSMVLKKYIHDLFPNSQSALFVNQLSSFISSLCITDESKINMVEESIF